MKLWKWARRTCTNGYTVVCVLPSSAVGVLSCASCSAYLTPLVLHAGKRVKVEPLAAVATPYLRQLLSALLLLVQSGSSAATGSSAAAGGNGTSKVSAMVEMDRCLKLQSMVVQARHCLAAALRGGNRACQGR